MTDTTVATFNQENVTSTAVTVEGLLNKNPEYRCLLLQKYQQEQQKLLLQNDVTKNTTDGCPAFFDTILCWPQTPSNTLAILPCFDEMNGVKYDASQNATRFCKANGLWDNSNYDQCHHLLNITETPDSELHTEISAYIYGSGYILSLTSLSLALIVFIYFKELRCLRNTIHANLFSTYILTGLLWILTLMLQITGKSDITGCIFLVILLHYFSLTNFFWMLVEGLYLYMLVVETFSGDQMSFRTYACIGWGLPAVIVVIWTITKSIMLSYEGDQIFEDKMCPWMHASNIDWIYQGPASACLIINLICLIRIMWVLITKLRSANTAETKQYRKAAKALLVLIPLLGITYLMLLYGPTEGVAKHIFGIIQALLISTQGFSVSLLYCFLNSEVRTALRHRIERWRDQRNLGSEMKNVQMKKGFFSLRYGRAPKEYSARSRTESIRTEDFQVGAHS